MRLVVLACFVLVFTSLVCFSQSEADDYILADGKPVKIQEGLDLSGKKLQGLGFATELDMYGDPELRRVVMRNVNFSESSLIRADLFGVDFIDCNFSRADLTNAVFYNGNGVIAWFGGTNTFTDAKIEGTKGLQLDSKQLQSTASYKNKTLAGTVLRHENYSYLSFAEFDLSRCTFHGCQMVDTCLTDAHIAGLNVNHLLDRSTRYKEEFETRREIFRRWELKIEQLLETKDFKTGVVNGVKIDRLTWPDHVVDLSNMVFIDCRFGYLWNLPIEPAKIDLTDSVISDCDFSELKGLTLENVKSTWNYKHGRMDGIKLPEAIQKVLDVEKEQR